MKNILCFLVVFVSFNLSLYAQWDQVYAESFGMSIVKKGNKYGFVDQNGKVVIPVEYDLVYSFKNDKYTVVQNGRKQGCVNKKGDIIVPIKYSKIQKSQPNGTAVVELDGKKGCIDYYGKLFVPLEYDEIYAFKNSYAKIIKDGKTGKVNLAGQITWNTQIGDIINNGIVFYVDKSGKHGLICSKKDIGRLDWLDAKDDCFAHEGYNSWRLPTLKEANLMINQAEAIRIANKGSNVLYGYYWTSTEGARGEYYAITTNQSGSLWKVSRELNVRAVKEF
jgi:hypothetical protein